jgi:hypothetical protein
MPTAAAASMAVWRLMLGSFTSADSHTKFTKCDHVLLDVVINSPQKISL